MIPKFRGKENTMSTVKKWEKQSQKPTQEQFEDLAKKLGV